MDENTYKMPLWLYASSIMAIVNFYKPESGDVRGGRLEILWIIWTSLFYL